MNATDSSAVKKQFWRGRLFSIIKMSLAHPGIIAGAAALGVLLFIPSLWLGLMGDDYVHRMVMLGQPALPGKSMTIFSAYDYVTANPEVSRIAMEIGLRPWWTAPDFKISFLRYLGSASIWLDYKLWPDSPFMMHLHSLVLYGVIVAAVAYFYRRIMGATWIAGLAALLFAIDAKHTGTVSWLANRYAPIALLFATLCLIAYDAWRTTGKSICAVLAPFFLGLALFSGEIGLAAAGFLFSYALFLDKGPLMRRMAALVPSGVVFCFWAVIYKLMGHGVRGSGMYIDPLQSPLVFMKKLFQAVPLYLMGQWTPIPAESGMYAFSKDTALVVALVCTLLLVLVLLPFLRRDRIARFFALSMLLACIPISGTDPNNRVLLFVGCGAMPLIALFLGGSVRALDYLPRARAWRIIAVVMGFFLALTHLVFSPLMIGFSIKANRAVLNNYASHIRSIPDDPKLAQQTLILVNPYDYIMSIMEAFSIRKADGKPNPAQYRTLAPCSGPIEIHRPDDRTLRVKTPEGLFRGFTRNVYRSSEEPMKQGDEYRLIGVTMTVNEADAEYGPTDVTYRFAVPLEDPSLRWLKLEKERYVPFALPAVGTTVMLQGRGLEEWLKEMDPAKL